MIFVNILSRLKSILNRELVTTDFLCYIVNQAKGVVMCWRTERLNIFKFIFATWQGNVQRVKIELESAKTEEEKKLAQEKYERIKNNPPNFPSM
jgi:hypothetical protein